jgi:branched-chain amino acid aminotransferase
MKITKTDSSKINSVDFNNLQFGKFFSDHMISCKFANGVWEEPELMPYQALQLNPGTHVFHYGQAVFEGMKAYKNKEDQTLLFRPLENLKRLNKSADRLCMPTIPEEIFTNGLNELLKIDDQWIPRAESQSLYIRPFMIATSEYIRATPATEFTFFIITSPTAQYYSGETNLKIEESFSRSFKGGVGFAKAAGNYAAAFSPTKKAQDQGFTQVIWTDAFEHKYIEESGTMNIMFLINDKLITPSLSESILAGITRDSILSIAKNKGIEVEERKVSINEVVEAYENKSLKEVFGVGTAVTVNPVNSITYKAKKMVFEACTESSMAMQLKQELLGIQNGSISDSFNWTVQL